jgi:hypothetical protein
MPFLVFKDGQQFGPFELDELTVHVQDRAFLLTDHCWREGWDDWHPIHSVIRLPAPAPTLASIPLPAPTVSTQPERVASHDAAPRVPRRAVYIWGGIALGVLALCYFASPYWTLYRLKRAVDRNDAIFVSDHVDFPQFRESVKGAVMASLAKEAAKDDAEGIEALGAAFGALMVGPMIDSLVTPEGLIQMMQGRDMGSIVDGEPGPCSRPFRQNQVRKTGKAKRWTSGMEVSEMGYETLNRFAVTLAGDVDESTLERKSVTVLFSRRGLDRVAALGYAPYDGLKVATVAGISAPSRLHPDDAEVWPENGRQRVSPR